MFTVKRSNLKIKFLLLCLLYKYESKYIPTKNLNFGVQLIKYHLYK